MPDKITRIVWTRQALESLTSILEYRYSEIPTVYKIVRTDIIQASKNIVFSKQYQKTIFFRNTGELL